MSVESTNASPLYSTLLEREPELIDLIKKYVNKYPEMIRDLKLAYMKKNKDEFNQRLHDLKSTGGNYGFMLITELAIKTRDYLKSNNFVAVEKTLDEMEDLHQRMSLALLS